MRAILAIFVMLFITAAISAHAGPYDVTNLQISIQTDNTVKARDEAITRAQRVAFAQLTGQSEEQTASVTDAQISRLVRDFSLRGERLAAHFYQAVFTIRFDPARTQNFIDTNGLNYVDPSTLAPVAINEGGAQATTTSATTATDTAAPVLQTIAVLPVLDIGSRRVVWDEPNPWRDVWQKTDHSNAKVRVALPLGDASDVTDIPNADFLTPGSDVQGVSANINQFLQRYGAQTLYIIIAKNQGAALDPSGGMALSLYKHDGKQLKFLRKNVIRPRPGYLFDDAVPAGLQMVLQDHGVIPPATTTTVTATASPSVTTPAQSTASAYQISDLFVTVPYQSLAQWVGIQQRLRRVAGVSGIQPVRLSPSSAQIRLITTISEPDLVRNMSLQGFDLQKLPNGERALTERAS